MTIQNNVLKFDKLYNGEEKKAFINQYESVDSQLTIYWQFLKVAPFEFQANKDMSEMTGAEIKEMLLSAECSTITSAINHINTYKRYIDYMTTTSPFYQFESYSELASEVVAKEKNKRYSKEELMFMLDELNNYTDQALLLALFEGIKGKSFSELLTLKRENLHVIEEKDSEECYVADVYDEGTKEIRRVRISEDLYKLLILADKQTAYRTNNQDEIIETPFNEYEYIFKKAKKGRQGGNVLDRHFITRKFVFFKEFFGNIYLTAEDIVQSGMMYMAYTLFKQSGKLGKTELLIIGEHYDTIMATSNGKDYYRNITDLKRKIFNEQLGKLYSELEGVEYSD